MITIKFGTWSYYSARWFRYTRIYIKGYKWTPFVKVGVIGWGEKQDVKEYPSK